VPEVPVKKISDEQRAELTQALASGTIENFSAYADAFAATHGLKRNTVRSAVTRLRREMRDGGPVRVTLGSPGSGMTTQILTGDVERVSHIGAAALVRYRRDPEFRKKVDRLRPEVEHHYDTLLKLEEAAEALSPEDQRVAIESLYSRLTVRGRSRD
jgi:pantoate kinase